MRSCFSMADSQQLLATHVSCCAYLQVQAQAPGSREMRLLRHPVPSLVSVQHFSSGSHDMSVLLPIQAVIRRSSFCRFYSTSIHLPLQDQFKPPAPLSSSPRSLPNHDPIFSRTSPRPAVSSFCQTRKHCDCLFHPLDRDLIPLVRLRLPLLRL